MKRKTRNKSHYGKYQKNNKRLKKILPCYGTGSGSDWGNFLHSSPYGAALLWICGKNSAGNTPVLWLLLSIACTASRLHFSSTMPAPATRPGVSKKLGEDTVGQNWLIPGSLRKMEGGLGKCLLLGDGNCLCRISSHYPPLLHLLCVYLNPLLFPFSPTCPRGRRKQLGSAQAAHQGQPW